MLYCTSFAYRGYFSHSFLTSARTKSNAASFSAMILVISLATRRASSSLNPRVVMPGVPTRMPLVMNGLVSSNGMVFLLTVMLS